MGDRGYIAATASVYAYAAGPLGSGVASILARAGLGATSSGIAGVRLAYPVNLDSTSAAATSIATRRGSSP